MSDYQLGHARVAEQAERMRRLAAEGTCFFCPGERRSLLHETAHWSVAPNDYPYEGTRVHLLLAPFVHATDLLDLDAEVRDDLWAALGWVRAELGLAHYSIGVRCGDPAATGATIAHVHVHVVVGDVTDPDHRPVRFKMSSAVPRGPAAPPPRA